MFSEYASKFLSQSQSRLSLGGNPENRNPLEQQPNSRARGAPSFLQSRNQQRRGNNMPFQNPYNSGIQGGMNRFAFASRTSNAPAPLFYSATDDFREQDDHVEHDREIADHYALQRSRAQFGRHSNLSESSEVDDDGMERRSIGSIEGDTVQPGEPGYGLGRGIKSSWKGDKPSTRGRSGTVVEKDEEREESVPASESSAPSSKGKDRLVDIELASTVRGSIDDLEPPEELLDDRPPPYQQFRKNKPLRTTLPIPQETDEDTLLQEPAPVSPDRTSAPLEAVVAPPPSPKHNFFWAELFLITQCAMFGIFFISLLQESVPKSPLGDTIYTVLHASFHLIGVYSLVSICVGLLWLSLLRSFARPLIMLMLVAVPVISFSFFLYPLVWSYKGFWGGHSAQDSAMRWFSLGPLCFAIFWIYTTWKGRRNLQKAAEMLEFSSNILRAQSPLLLVGIVTLAAVILWSWLWMLMFTRLFLGGHWKSKEEKKWIIDLSTWWLGALFFLDYFWTLAVIAGIQRSTTAATVSQWYFHRNKVPVPSSRLVVQASASHAVTTMLGTVCLSTLISLLVRLPLIVLPRRIAGLLASCAYALIPTPIAALTNPLTVTYASIHSLPLTQAARGLSNLSFLSPESPTTTLGPRSFAPSRGGRPSIVSYRLAKLLLHAIRWTLTLALGFGGWVSTSKLLRLNETYRGSLYAYVIGLISAAIGWGAMGAMESVLGGILDAVLVCWASEVGYDGVGDARYCVDAGRLFGDEVEAPTRRRHVV